MPSLTDIVKGNIASISHCINGVLYYTINVNGETYQFYIDMNDKEDVGTSIFNKEEKAITLMRYIRKCINSEEFIKL